VMCKAACLNYSCAPHQALQDDALS
jgi:hypothetical protein